MLIEFRVENHRSLRDEQVLTMEAGRLGEEADPRLRHVPGHPEPLLPVAVLYGANASGKSNVLDALRFMCDAVRDSHSQWRPEGGVPRDPFAWGESRTKPSFFELTLLLDGVRYQYGFVANDESFLEEWLFAWPNGKKQLWFERDGHAFKFGENLKGENKLIEGVTRPNALFLSTAAQHIHPQLRPLWSWFDAEVKTLRCDRLQSFMYSDTYTYISNAIARSLFCDDPAAKSLAYHHEKLKNDLKAQFLSLLRNADLGIADVRAEEVPYEPQSGGATPYRYYLKHIGQPEDAWLPLQQESRGTQALFCLLFPVVLTLTNGRMLLIDELDASLHPSLAREIVHQFNDPATNPYNVQLIFTTHDTNLLGTTLGEPAFRRDQVWLTEKDDTGATVLYPLTDYKPRKAENLERGYLQGRYGAIPFLDSFRLLEEDAS